MGGLGRPFLTFLIVYGIINIESKKKGGSMGKTISQDIINQIPILYKELGVKKKVADQLGISVSTVNKYLNLGEAIKAKEETKQKPRVKITPELIEKLNELYAKEKNMAEVARQLGISITSVKNHLSEENSKLRQTLYDDRDALFFYIYRLFGEFSPEQPVDPWNITQMQKFVKQGMTYRGQLLTLKYFYEVRGNKVQDKYKTIGIIPYQYRAAEQYYTAQASRAQEIISAIKRQLEKDRIEIKIDPAQYMGSKKKKKTIDLSTLGDD